MEGDNLVGSMKCSCRGQSLIYYPCTLHYRSHCS